MSADASYLRSRTAGRQHSDSSGESYYSSSDQRQLTLSASPLSLVGTIYF